MSIEEGIRRWIRRLVLWVGFPFLTLMALFMVISRGVVAVSSLAPPFLVNLDQVIGLLCSSQGRLLSIRCKKTLREREVADLR